MELNENVLRQLAELEQDERSILSVYLDLSQRWEAAESRLDASVDRLRRALAGAEREALDVALDLAREELDRRKAQGLSAPGLALFVSPDDGVQHSVMMPSPPRTLVTFDHEATVYPLAFQLDEYEPVGVILADASGARILVVAGRLQEELDSTSATIRHLTKVGGWSQMRYQRRRGEQVKRAADEVVEAAREAFADSGVERVVLAGRQQMLTAIRDAMPQRLERQVVGTLAWDMDAADDELLASIRPMLEEAEREQEAELLDQFTAELKRGGLAAAGLQETRRALEWGAVEVLLLAPACVGAEREELTAMAATTAADVEILPDAGPPLEAAGGVGALLRFPVYD